MKFLAILEDSFREAVASYVCMVQIALSVVFVVMLGSVSFVPMDAHRALQPLGTYLFVSAHADESGPRFPAVALAPRDPIQMGAIEPLDGQMDSPATSYRMTLQVVCVNPQAASELRQSPQAMCAFIQHHFGRLSERRYYEVIDDVHLIDARTMPATSVYFEVKARPTENARLLWPYSTTALFGLISLDEGHGIPLGTQLWEIENHVISIGAAWILILLSIVVTAFLVPNMLRKGAVDLLLVRPMHRVRLLVYKYLSGVVYILANVALLIGALWAVLGLRTGIWKPGILVSIPVLTFFFAILYAVSVFYGVLTRSAVTAILVTCIVWFGLWLVGTLHAAIDQTRAAPTWEPWVYPVVDTLHAILPRTTDLNVLMEKVISHDLLDAWEARNRGMAPTPSIKWRESLTVSFAFVGVLLGAASWRFYRKDY
jgi:ABC-type transport system involved in multi-copper enzyme maturation permease subunit